MSNNEEFNPSNKPLDSAWVPPIEPQPNYPTQGEPSASNDGNFSNGNPYTAPSTDYANPYISSSGENANPYTAPTAETTNPYVAPTSNHTNTYGGYDTNTNTYTNTQGSFSESNPYANQADASSSYSSQMNTGSIYSQQSYTSSGQYGSGNHYTNPNYNNGGYYNNPTPEKNTTATISLIVGIVGILLCCCCGLGILAGIIAIILAIVSKGGKPMTGVAIGGLITGIIAIILGIVSFIFILTSDEFQNQYYKNYYNQSQDLFEEEANVEEDNLFNNNDYFQFVGFENEVTDTLLKDIANFK